MVMVFICICQIPINMVNLKMQVEEGRVSDLKPRLARCSICKKLKMEHFRNEIIRGKWNGARTSKKEDKMKIEYKARWWKCDGKNSLRRRKRWIQPVFVQKVKEIKGMESQPGSWPMRNQLKEMSGREAGQKRMEGRRGKLVRQFATSSSPSPPLLPSSTRWYLLSKIVTESTQITSIWMVEYKLSWLSEFNLWKSVHSMPP